MSVAILTSTQIGDVVRQYNANNGEMDKVLWCLSRNCRPALLAGRTSEIVETLIWTLKTWWGVQYVSTATKTLFSQALAKLTWSEDSFVQPSGIDANAEQWACDLVGELIQESLRLGVTRREYALATKTLHWLMPWRIPVYDSYVCNSMGISRSLDSPEAYHKLTHRVFAAARRLEADDPSWMGDVAPQSPLRALDKALWWLGGGCESNAMLVKDPWRVARHLGLPCIQSNEPAQSATSLP